MAGFSVVGDATAIPASVAAAKLVGNYLATHLFPSVLKIYKITSAPSGIQSPPESFSRKIEVPLIFLYASPTFDLEAAIGQSK